MALPALLQQGPLPGPPAFSALSPESRKAHNVKRRAEDGRRPAIPRRQSLRRVKDSKENLRRTRARGASSGTLESSTASTTTTPSGRSFTVANINRGIIYLRPVVRAGNQRNLPQADPFVFPQTPPDSATLDSRALRPSSNDWEQSIYGPRSPAGLELGPPGLQIIRDVKSEDGSHTRPNPPLPQPADTPPRPTAHLRSHSFSATDDHTVTSYSTEPGTFKVVIERPPFGRPKTADTGSLPFLEVPIPHYRLGTPRFSARGTAILRSSVLTRASGTEDFRSSLLAPKRATHSFLGSRHRSDVYSPISLNYRTTMDRMPLQPSTAPSSARVSKVPIGPQLYDALTVNPDDRSVVRFSPSGDILAATPSRLVAHITSPSFLDYELLSDFFLTFRSFLSSRDLVAYLISRLRWAVDRQDDFGRIVRVRTFVALRHWILNYFVDDFVPLFPLRVYFCELVNGLYKDLRAREDGGGGDIKIVGELKKCWRRTCALYWEIEDGIGRDSAGEELLPGGQAESQASIDEVAVLPVTPPRQTTRSAKVDTIGSNPSDHFASKHMDWAHSSRHTPQNSFSSPYVPSQDYEAGQIPLSPASEQSMQVLSCSIPMRGLTKAEPAREVPLYPHPIPHPAPNRVAGSPQHSASMKRPNRPSHSHKRSGSFSDAMRDVRAPLSVPKSTPVDAAISAVSNMPGSLVRGGIFQPSSPYIDVKNGTLRHTRSHLELQPVDVMGAEMHPKQGHATNPGMKKLFGSVRRALSSKQPSASSPQLPNYVHPSHQAPPTRSSNPGTISTVSGGVHKRRAARPRPQVRIDLLIAKVAESFKEAVKEEMKNESTEQSQPPDLGGFEFEFERADLATTEDVIKASEKQDTRALSHVTNGSRSIVIMDDTGPPDLPFMSGALPPPDVVQVPAIIAKAPLEARGTSIDEQPSTEDTSTVRHSDLYKNPEPVPEPLELRRTSRSSVQRPPMNQRRSMSEGQTQLHSFRRRGSSKMSMARSTSLRRRASYNSLSRHQAGASFTTSIRTMSSDNDPFFLDRHSTAPARQLRRRPGGDLRAVDNVQDLEHVQRPHSTGSISVRTHSISSSIILRSDRYVEPTSTVTKVKDEPMNEPEDEPKNDPKDEPTKQRSISLVATHSSQPNLRPSFEAEVAKLAALPDDVDDDGGIESALMKLEGRYEKKSPDPSPRITIEPDAYQLDGSQQSYMASEQTSTNTRSYGKEDGALHRPLALPESDGQGMYRLSSENFQRRIPGPTSAVESEDSYSSVPLLDRGLSDITSATRTRELDSMRSSVRPAPLRTNTDNAHPDSQSVTRLASPNSSIEYIVETDSMKRIPRDGTIPRSSMPRESFLLDEDEDLSDGSYSTATQRRSDRDSHGVRSFFDDEPAVLDSESDSLPTHPMRHPPTPPLTANRLNGSLPRVDTIFERGLPTPGLTPTSRLNNQAFGQSTTPVDAPIELQDLRKDTPPPPAHFPFILAYDSELLAQQFTIIEKDALDEIDWKELIELRWSQSSPQIPDWVTYLRTQEARGVDVAIARFNIVVKWAVSECVLTDAIEERARCIIKYIHIAAHARRLRNYATMYQLTIALLSADVSRLKNTWALIPAAELQTMRELEALVQPLKNFHNLRVEMETSTSDDGCIPFIGIYTRDLIYNSQKPAFIDAPPVDGERLVNFERHHTAATIVKSLLRLLEASSKYTFKPEPVIISKCLWMAALPDEELTALSRKLE
ncbi:ras GEF [Amniculicola lignicola CBS 123094]|uniref:Ras GEF n=1 Tax=Amniculicola lignicola CBS 123094 TaxID=1392246 RepID=A0A6A5WIB8_9PLEO|nr:ras GEF [Amniculicola lignicola CBS 123094]